MQKNNSISLSLHIKKRACEEFEAVELTQYVHPTNNLLICTSCVKSVS